MSHTAVRIVADWLANTTYGVDAIAAVVPRDGTDPAPPATHIYDETRHGWVARQQIPKANATVVFPAVLVFARQAKWDGGPADAQDTGARTIDGTVQLVVQLVLDVSTTEAAITAGLYLMRAIHNSLLQLDEHTHDADRTRTGVRILPSQDLLQGQVAAPQDDSLVSIGAFIVTYPTSEVTALTLP